jgi:hypothetical protein
MCLLPIFRTISALEECNHTRLSQSEPFPPGADAKKRRLDARARAGGAATNCVALLVVLRCNLACDIFILSARSHARANGRAPIKKTNYNLRQLKQFEIRVHTRVSGRARTISSLSAEPLSSSSVWIAALWGGQI